MCSSPVSPAASIPRCASETSSCRSAGPTIAKPPTFHPKPEGAGWGTAEYFTQRYPNFGMIFPDEMVAIRADETKFEHVPSFPALSDLAGGQAPGERNAADSTEHATSVHAVKVLRAILRER